MVGQSAEDETHEPVGQRTVVQESITVCGRDGHSYKFCAQVNWFGQMIKPGGHAAGAGQSDSLERHWVLSAEHGEVPIGQDNAGRHWD